MSSYFAPTKKKRNFSSVYFYVLVQIALAREGNMRWTLGQEQVGAMKVPFFEKERKKSSFMSSPLKNKAPSWKKKKIFERGGNILNGIFRPFLHQMVPCRRHHK